MQIAYRIFLELPFDFLRDIGLALTILRKDTRAIHNDGAKA
jgi:hypothetical protein